MLIINFIRSLIFSILFYLDTILLLILVFLGKLIGNKKMTKKVSKNWTALNIFLLKWICGIKYEVIGKENIPKSNFLIVSKHQSTWETYFLFCYFRNYLACVVKKELLLIPGLGIALKSVGCIAIDRHGGINVMKKMLEESKYFAQKERRNLLIFPQGTRVPPCSSTEKYPYKNGFVAIAMANKMDLLPVSLNSGMFWPKGSLIKKPGTVKVKISPLIKYEEYKNLNKDEITKLVENAIESGQNEIEK